jgi:DNA-binding MarR family transcriptional regulator
MLSKPDVWRFFIEVIARELHINKDTAAKYVNELIAAGYVKRERRRENGRFAGWTYFVYEAGQAVYNEEESGNIAISTVSDNTISGEIATSITDFSITDVNKKQDDDDDVYNAHTREESPIDNENTMQFNVCQAEIYETAQEYGFNDDTARLLALRCEGIRTTATAISNALVAVIKRISDASLPRVMSVPAYFYATLRDEANRERVTYVHRQKERQERERVAQLLADYKPYNWLADVM